LTPSQLGAEPIIRRSLSGSSAFFPPVLSPAHQINTPRFSVRIQFGGEAPIPHFRP